MDFDIDKKRIPFAAAIILFTTSKIPPKSGRAESLVLITTSALPGLIAALDAQRRRTTLSLFRIATKTVQKK